MAMGNFCYIQNIECPYATTLGTCRDDIYPDFNKCEMNGDDMPPIEWPSHERRSWCSNQNAPGKSVIPVPNAEKQCGE